VDGVNEASRRHHSDRFVDTDWPDPSTQSLPDEVTENWNGTDTLWKDLAAYPVSLDSDGLTSSNCRTPIQTMKQIPLNSSMIRLNERPCAKQTLYVPSVGRREGGLTRFLKQIAAPSPRVYDLFTLPTRPPVPIPKGLQETDSGEYVIDVSRLSTPQRAAHFSKTSESAVNGLRKWRSQMLTLGRLPGAHRLELLEPSPDEETRSDFLI